MISRDGPAQVNDRGHRRDGGASFMIAFTRGDEDESRETRTSPWRLASGLVPQPSRRRPRCVDNILPKLSPALWSHSAAPFFFAVT
jgi:hypothetical protein